MFMLFKSIFFFIVLTSFSISANDLISPCYNPTWTSGDIEEHESGHGFFTRQALSIVRNENKAPFYQELIDQNLEFLAAKSSEPDKTENNFYTFSGHFYDPDTEKNWLGSQSNTALTNFLRHSQKALKFFKENPYSSLTKNRVDYKEGLKSLAYALHYLEDSCVPHHAANYVAVSTWHREFEHYAQKVQEKSKIMKSHHPYIERGNFNDDLRMILRSCAIYAKPFVKVTEVTDSSYADTYVQSRCYEGQNGSGAPDCAVWDEVIDKTAKETQSRVAQFLARFFDEL